jgi:THO complex subunit 7
MKRVRGKRERKPRKAKLKRVRGIKKMVSPRTMSPCPLLNPRAHVFVLSRNSAPVDQPSRITRSHFNPAGSAPPSIVIHDPPNSDDDIEMGELAEEREPLRGKKKLRREELEEGEASDESSELSDPPDD